MCTKAKLALYKDALKTRSPNFNHDYILVLLPSISGIYEVVAIHTKDKKVIPLYVDIEPKGEVQFSLDSNKIGFSGNIYGYRNDSTGDFVFALLNNESADDYIRFTRVYED